MRNGEGIVCVAPYDPTAVAFGLLVMGMVTNGLREWMNGTNGCDGRVELVVD